MAFSTLYSALCRGKWFISCRDVDANLLLVHKLLSHDASISDGKNKSESEPIQVMLEHEGAVMKRGNTFADAPQGSTAIIPVHGTMLKYGTMCSYGTTEIASVIDEAAQAKSISSILLDMDSGGGSVDAIAPLIDAIRSAQSKRKAVVAYCDLCASAAYYVASYCNEIVAGYEKGYNQDRIIRAFLFAYNIKANAMNYEAVKKYDYRVRKRMVREVDRDIRGSEAV